jgi:hypothetical protein
MTKNPLDTMSNRNSDGYLDTFSSGVCWYCAKSINIMSGIKNCPYCNHRLISGSDGK